MNKRFILMEIKSRFCRLFDKVNIYVYFCLKDKRRYTMPLGGLERLHEQECAREAKANRKNNMGYVAIHASKGLLWALVTIKNLFLKK